MEANELILERFPEPAVIRERLQELTSERNLLQAILRVIERDGWDKERRSLVERRQQMRQPVAAAG